jgi:hypothetical protein
MKTEELKNIIKESINKEIKNAILESVSEEVFIIKNKEGDPIEQFKTEEEAEKALEVYKKDHPDQELIIEKGKKLSFEELDTMSEKLENMENINETKHKGHFTMEQVMKLAKKAGEYVLDAKDALEELCEMYGDKVPASRVFEVLDDYDMPELKSKIKLKKAEPKEGDFVAPELSVDEKLYGNQDKLDVDGDGEIEADDLAKLRDGEHNEEEKDCMECGDGYMKEEGVCEECGKEICECGSMMNESKDKIRVSESELVNLIKKMVNEAIPGLETQQKSHKESGSQNKEALSDVEKKIKDYLNFDGNNNPEFPNQIGGEVKARRADDAESEEVADHRGGGLEDLIYDIDPSKEAQERHEMALKGDTKMGNSQDAANVIPSKLGEKIIKKVKRKDKEEENMPMYNKDVQPTKHVNESEEASKKVVSEEIQRMKQMASYNKKTQ